MRARNRAKRPRTTIELSPEHRRKLAELAARQGTRGVSGLIAAALDVFFSTREDEKKSIDEFRSLRGSITEEEAEEALKAVQRAQEWT